MYDFLNYILSTKRLKLSTDEIKECFEVVFFTFEASFCLREKGIPYLIKLNDEKFYKYSILHKGVKYITMGLDYDIIEDILYNYILSLNCNGKLYLQSIISCKGILLMKLNYAPMIILENLKAYLGIELDKVFDEQFNIYLNKNSDLFSTPYSKITPLPEDYVKDLLKNYDNGITQ